MIRRGLFEKRRLAAVLIMVLVFTVTVQPAAGIFASESTRDISSAEDLFRLSEESRDESYTKDVHYVLLNDIDLGGREFLPVSIFAGSFDGKGHVISGLKISERQYKTGFIRTVTKSGRIENLKLKGSVEPSGEMSEVGGIAGVNYGLIKDCSFEGSVLAFEIAGGIAGRNMEGGSIENCVNSASVNAVRRTGGITGFNEGEIISSENKGDINASKKSAKEMVDEINADEEEEENGLDRLIPDNIDIKDDDLFKRYDNGQKINYTGGIAGVCSGTIRDSVNTGTVGYFHSGYKTGGIAGYDRGIIVRCNNKGKIYGRKDTGGITGQFEPYAVNAYGEDSLSKTGDALTKLSDKTEELHKDFGTEDQKTQANIDAIRNTSDALRQVIKNYKEYYRCKDDMVEREIREKTDNIRAITDSIDLDSYDRDTRDAITALIDNSEPVSKLLDAAIEARAAGVNPDMVNYLGKMSGIITVNNEAMDTLIEKALKANKKGKDLEDDLDKLRNAYNDLDDYLKGCQDDYKKDFRITGDDIQGYVDRIAAESDALFDGLKISDSALRKDVDSLVSSLNVFNDNLSGSYREVQEELQKIYDTEDKGDVFTDLSDDDDPEPKKGVILSSVNEGDIETDINGGGIAGTITDDPDTQSDFEVVSEGQISLNYDRYEKATILKCRNSGDITVQNNYAGGIVGRADLGAVIDSGNFGRIEVTDGDYAGGIAGRSNFVIRDSDSMCEAIGSKYAGGIAGLGHTMINNVTLSAIDQDKEYHGAVAGDTDNRDLEDKKKGTVSGNTFVYRGLGAVNGVTDRAEALAVSYEELIKTEGAADEFSTMTVTFKDEGSTVKKIRVPYGGSVPKEDYPEVVGSIEGKAGYWEETDLSNIEQNMTVNAVYVDYITSIAAGSREKPSLILGGRFYEGTTLNYSEEPMESDIPGHGHIYKKVEFDLDDAFGIPENDKFTVRYCMDGEKVTPGIEDIVILKDSNGYYSPEIRRDGDYLVFEMPEEGCFFLAKGGTEKLWPAALAAAVIAAGLIILILILIFRRRKKKHAGRK